MNSFWDFIIPNVMAFASAYNAGVALWMWHMEEWGLACLNLGCAVWVALVLFVDLAQTRKER